jgi:hypothetical protein
MEKINFGNSGEILEDEWKQLEGNVERLVHRTHFRALNTRNISKFEYVYTSCNTGLRNSFHSFQNYSDQEEGQF